MNEEQIQIVRKEFGYRQILMQQLNTILYLASNILFTKKKIGKVSKINYVNFKFAVRALATALKPYWTTDFATKFVNRKNTFEAHWDIFGELMLLMKSNNLLLEEEYVPGPDDAI